MHRLLKRQLKRIYGSDFSLDSLSELEQSLIDQVSSTYEEMDKERRHYEHMLELSVNELNEKNRTVQEALVSLSDAQRLTKTGSWTLDLQSNEQQWSDELYRIFNFSQDEIHRVERSFNLVHPDDRDKVDFHLTKTKRNGEFDEVYRLKFADGDIKYVHEHREIQFDRKGNAVAIQGTLQDVTEQKLTEENLNLFANVFHHSGEGILILDQQYQIVSVNQALCNLMGYSNQQQIIESQPSLIKGEEAKKITDYLARVSSNEDFWQGELEIYKKDGSLFSSLTSVSVIEDSTGQSRQYIVSVVDITEQKMSQERIYRLAHHDSLTGLINRFSFEERLQQAISTAERERNKLAFLFIDMDRFKLINDTYGHSVGDALLVEVAARLLSLVRSSDIVARIGGDEFVVVYTNFDDEMVVTSKAKALIDELARPYRVCGKKLYSTPSVGISIYPEDGESVASLMKNADMAMYHAKSQGRGNFQFFLPSMNVAAAQHVKMESDLRTAIEQRHFELHFQPVISSATGSVVAVEALLRWQHPELGMIPPDVFIPVAEESKLILPLGNWVLEEAFRHQYMWRTQYNMPLKVAINLSSLQLRSTTLVEKVKSLIEKYDIHYGDIELEVTESVAMENAEHAIQRLDEIRKLGLSVAIDDFGTGYSSLAYLKMLPIDTLKLDRTFVHDLELDDNNAKISAATLALAHNLGLKVVAEGVENHLQCDFLVEHGCEFMQGYYFSKALPAKELADFVHSWEKPGMLKSG